MSDDKKLKYEKKLNLICRIAGNVSNTGTISERVDTAFGIFEEVEKRLLTENQD